MRYVGGKVHLFNLRARHHVAAAAREVERLREVPAGIHERILRSRGQTHGAERVGKGVRGVRLDVALLRDPGAALRGGLVGHNGAVAVVEDGVHGGGGVKL